MKRLFMLLIIAMLAGCAAPYQYNPNLSPQENAYLELEYRRMQQQAWAQRSAALQRYSEQLNRQENQNYNSGSSRCRWVGNEWHCNNY